MRKRTADQAGLDQNGEEGGIAHLFRTLLHRLTDAQPDLTNPVINGATQLPKPVLKRLMQEIASQADRWTSNMALTTSTVGTKLLDGGVVDDRKYQMEAVIQLAASLPPESDALKSLSSNFIKLLWNTLEHPPLSILDETYKYRTADGSHNNLKYPDMGKAGQPYARTVSPQTLKPGVLPDPAVIFDAVFARDENVKEHPNKISSMLFYLASIIIHDVFGTNEHDYSRVKTSSYLDLAPLYGNNLKEQKEVRLHRNGLLKPDVFANVRILGFPPGVAALLICFNRYHNYVAMQLKEINEGGRFTPRPDDKDGTKLDNDLFQTARLITSGLYVNIILTDYVRTILNLNRTNSTWTLDPRQDPFYSAEGIPSGIGNQVSVEFNLVYRWHSAISKNDEIWTEALYRKIVGNDAYDRGLTKDQLLDAMRGWVRDQGPHPSKWKLDGGKYQRNEQGMYEDADLIDILTAATEDVACAFGPRQVPVVMRLISVLGIEQARAWNVATLNEFRKFFKLEPHRTFTDITRNTDVAHALKSLYHHPDYVELYPGLVAEDAKDPYEAGSGLCPGYTTSRTILADAVALVRGDRFYTIDYSPSTLTNWGFNQVKSDPQVAQGGCFYNLVMRALPSYYRGNSVYALYPFTIPSENAKIHEKLGIKDQYSYERPSFVPVPKSVKTWRAVVGVLNNQVDFRVPWAPHTYYITGYDYMLSSDKASNAAQKQEITRATYCPGWAREIREFYEALTTQLVEIKSERLRDDWYQLDACRDVGNPSHAVFVAQLYSLPLKTAESLNPLAVEPDQLYLALAVLFAYVFLDADTARSFKLRLGAKTAGDALGKLVKLVVTQVKVGSHLHINTLLNLARSGRLLKDYGYKYIERLLSSGKSVDEVTWAIIPTAAAAVATQAQHFAQMLDLYLSKDYAHHWPTIQRLAASDSDEDFEVLKAYALEANRLQPAAWGLLRHVANSTTVIDGKVKRRFHEDETIYLDFVAAGRDPTMFPDPLKIKLDRPRDRYIHFGHGPHQCLGHRMVTIAMAAQLKVFARLRNLRRAPGPQGEMKSFAPTPNPVSSDPEPSPGAIRVYMKEDWSDWWPFPTTLKVHHEGFSSADGLEDKLRSQTGYPGLNAEILKNRAENRDMNGLAPDEAINGTA